MFIYKTFNINKFNINVNLQPFPFKAEEALESSFRKTELSENLVGGRQFSTLGIDAQTGKFVNF